MNRCWIHKVISIVISSFKCVLASKYASLGTVRPVLGFGDALNTPTRWALHVVCCPNVTSWSFPRSKPSFLSFLPQCMQWCHISVVRSVPYCISVSLWSVSSLKNLFPLEGEQPDPSWEGMCQTSHHSAITQHLWELGSELFLIHLVLWVPVHGASAATWNEGKQNLPMASLPSVVSHGEVAHSRLPRPLLSGRFSGLHVPLFKVHSGFSLTYTVSGIVSLILSKFKTVWKKCPYFFLIWFPDSLDDN